MDDIAHAAGVTKPLLYQHFKSKRALFLELVDDVVVRIIERPDRRRRVGTGPASAGGSRFLRLLPFRASTTSPPSGCSSTPCFPTTSRWLRRCAGSTTPSPRRSDRSYTPTSMPEHQTRVGGGGGRDGRGSDTRLASVAVGSHRVYVEPSPRCRGRSARQESRRVRLGGTPTGSSGLLSAGLPGIRRTGGSMWPRGAGRSGGPGLGGSSIAAGSKPPWGQAQAQASAQAPANKLDCSGASVCPGGDPSSGGSSSLRTRRRSGGCCRPGPSRRPSGCTHTQAPGSPSRP